MNLKSTVLGHLNANAHQIFNILINMTIDKKNYLLMVKFLRKFQSLDLKCQLIVVTALHR
jgi:hypothetical protein